MLKSKYSRGSHNFNQDYFLFSIDLWIKLAGVLLLIITGGLITACSLLKYNVTVKGTSLIRPLGGTKLVESQKEGTIKDIVVEKNQMVDKGDIIAILDQTEIELQKNQLISNIQQKQLKLAQIDAQIKLLNQQIIAESEFFEQEFLIGTMQLNQIENENKKQKISAQTNLQEMEAALVLAANETKVYENLFNEGIISELELQEKQAALTIAQARLINAQASNNVDEKEVMIAKTKLEQLMSRKTTALANLNQQQESLLRDRLELETALNQEEKSFQQIEIDLEKSIIRASAKGVILELNLTNEQQFINVNDVIAVIIPQDVNLIITTLVSSQDIDKVAIGQPVKLQVNACPYQEFGTLPGVVTQISPDVVSANPVSNSQNQANTSYFEVAIKPEKLLLTNGKVECVIKPGMEAEANIISRQETFLQFILRQTRLSN